MLINGGVGYLAYSLIVPEGTHEDISSLVRFAGAITGVCYIGLAASVGPYINKYREDFMQRINSKSDTA